nr:uncharacterized protein LOC109400482 [Aedes albopictus]
MIRRDQPTQSSASSTTLMDDGAATGGGAVATVRDFRSKSIDGGGTTTTVRRDSKDRGSRGSTIQSPSAMVYMPVGINQIKEEASDPDIHPDSEVSLDANSTLAQVLEDFSNDEAPHEPEIEIKTHSRGLEEPTFRKHHFSASQKVLQLQQMGNLAYQLSDQLFKPTPMNILTKDMLEQKITEKDPDLVYRKHHNNNSTWARYMPMYYKGVKQNYVRCLECGWLVLHKASTGTGSLLRHKCKIKLPSGVEVKIEQQTPSTRNLPSKASAAVGSTSSHAVKFQTTVMPTNVVDDLVRQQACFLYKDLSSVDLFDSHSFRTFAQMLVNIGVYYGQQDIAFLADRTRLMDQVLPTIYQQARIQLNQALVDCDLSYSFNLFRSEAEGKTFATINSYTVAEDYYFRKINVKTVPVEDLESFVEGLPSIIVDMIEKEHNEPLKLVYGTKLDVRSDDFELIPCVVTALWGVMKNIMDMFKFDSEQYVDKILFSDEDDEEDAMRKILAPFKEPIRSLVSEGNVTISEVVLWKKKLERHFRVEETDDENLKTIKEAFQMQIKQSLKLHDYHKIAVFLDPKFKGLRFLSEDERSETLAIVKAQLRRDQDGIEQLKKLYSSGKKNNVEIGKETKFYEFMDVSLEVESADVVDDEIRQYVDVKLEAPIDVLSYWRNENAFPLLKKLCQRVLNIPAACDDMKLRFAGGGQRDFLKKRAVLREEEIDMMLYLNQNGP